MNDRDLKPQNRPASGLHRAAGAERGGVDASRAAGRTEPPQPHTPRPPSMLPVGSGRSAEADRSPPESTRAPPSRTQAPPPGRTGSPSSASNARARLGVGYGQGVHDLSDADVLDADALVASLVALLRSPTYQPPLLPSVALELLTLARRPDTTVRQIDALLAADPVLAANVLRVANSPAFSPGGKVRTLHDAIVRLGTRTIAAIFFDVWTNAKVFRAPGYEAPMTTVRRHSSAVAHLARMVSRKAGLDDDYAYLCGLLHDIGVAIGLLTISDARPRESLPEPFELCHALREAHAEIGATLCEHWKLPPDLVVVVRSHHHLVVGGRVHLGAAIVRVADNLAIRHGFGLEVDEADPAEEALARHALRLTDAHMHGIEEEAKALLEQLD